MIIKIVVVVDISIFFGFQLESFNPNSYHLDLQQVAISFVCGLYIELPKRDLSRMRI